MKISIIGSGYVGLVVGACLAKSGNRVELIDIDSEKVAAINKRIPVIYEEGLEEILNQVEIRATSTYDGLVDSDYIYICVGTPSNNDGSIALHFLTEVVEQIARTLDKIRDYCVIVVKSTVTPGTSEELILPLLESSGKKAGADFGLCVSPEFLREGKAIYDFMNPDRIIIGEFDKRSGDRLEEVYRNFKAPMVLTNLRTAEMIKLASNAFLATKISFINEIGNVCKQLGIDAYDVARGMGLDQRIGNKFLNPGIGFGGSCLPKDLRALIEKSRQSQYEPKLLKEVLGINERQALRVIELVKKHVPLKGAVVGLLGLAFKPGTDDIRDSRAIRIVEALLEEGAVVKAYDPLAMDNFRTLFPQIVYGTKEDVLNSDALILVTEWEEFNNLDYRGKIVVDGRRVLKAKEARAYEGICW